MSVDRRRSPRVELLGQLHGRVVPYDVNVTVRNISLGGMSIESPFPFPVGVSHDFRLTLGDESSVRLRGAILRCDSERAADGSTYFLTGIRFLDESPEEAEAGIGDIMERLE